VPRVPPAARGVCDRAAPAFRRHVGMYTVRIKASAAGSNLVALRRVGACRQGFVIIQKLNRFKAMKRTTSDPSPCHREFRIGETGITAGPLSPLGAGRRKAAHAARVGRLRLSPLSDGVRSLRTRRGRLPRGSGEIGWYREPFAPIEAIDVDSCG
jgi:hypothetical protein